MFFPPILPVSVPMPDSQVLIMSPAAETVSAADNELPAADMTAMQVRTDILPARLIFYLIIYMMEIDALVGPK